MNIFTTVVLWRDPMLMKDMSFFPVAASSVYDPVKMSKTSIRRWGRDKNLKGQEQNLNNEHGDSEWTGSLFWQYLRFHQIFSLKPVYAPTYTQVSFIFKEHSSKKNYSAEVRATDQRKAKVYIQEMWSFIFHIHSWPLCLMYLKSITSYQTINKNRGSHLYKLMRNKDQEA